MNTDKIITEEIDDAARKKLKEDEKLRNMIFPYVRSGDIDMDGDEGTAEVSFENEKVAKSVIDMWRRFWPSDEGYEILSVEALPMGKDFNSIFAKRNGGTCMYKITFKKNPKLKKWRYINGCFH
jgi:hypothetical protein